MRDLFNAIAKLNSQKNKLRTRAILSDEDIWELKNLTSDIAKKLIELGKRGDQNDKNA